MKDECALFDDLKIYDHVDNKELQSLFNRDEECGVCLIPFGKSSEPQFIDVVKSCIEHLTEASQ